MGPPDLTASIHDSVVLRRAYGNQSRRSPTMTTWIFNGSAGRGSPSPCQRMRLPGICWPLRSGNSRACRSGRSTCRLRGSPTSCAPAPSTLTVDISDCTQDEREAATTVLMNMKGLDSPRAGRRHCRNALLRVGGPNAPREGATHLGQPPDGMGTVAFLHGERPITSRR